MRSTLFVVLILYLSACAPDNEPKPSPSAEPTPESDISVEDLPAIRERNVLRLVAPRFDGADALPRGGVPVLDYQRLAEEFAAEQNLEVKWVFVDGYDALFPSLNEGLGDIIITNMTVTEARREQVSFTRHLAQVDELLITRNDQILTLPEDLKTLSLSIPAGTAYLETLYDKGLRESVEILGTDISDGDVLDGLQAGEYQATVIDSDVANKLLPIYPELKVAGELRKNRPIAWAVRKNNPKLLRALNEFLVSHHVTVATKVAEFRDWEAIKQSGKLRMLTLNNPASYFMWRGELMGFDFELLEKFARDNGLHLAVVIKDSIPELFEALKNGEGDVIAASITRTKEREALGLQFSEPYLFVSEQLVGRVGGPQVASVDELQGHSIGVNPVTVFYQRLRQMLDATSGVEIVEIPGMTTENLISMLGDEAFDFTIADSHLVNIEETYHENIVVNFDISDEVPIAWALRPNQTTLLDALNGFIKRHYRGLFYNVIVDKYFKNARKIKRFQGERAGLNGQLTPYDELLKKYAQKYNMDWRLLAAQMYQESHFNPDAESFAGALGLMQVMPRTAKQFGYEELRDPETSIAAGTEYMRWLEDRFPGELDVQERIYFTLAAYNAGTGHVRDARRLAVTLGHDPNRWFGHVEKAMLKLSQPQYYKNSRFGYVRGHEPVAYVRSIRDRYLGYLRVTGLPGDEISPQQSLFSAIDLR